MIPSPCFTMTQFQQAINNTISSSYEQSPGFIVTKAHLFGDDSTLCTPNNHLGVGDASVFVSITKTGFQGRVASEIYEICRFIEGRVCFIRTRRVCVMSRTHESRGVQSRGYGAAKTIYRVLVWVVWLVKVLLMGAGEALAALYKQLKLLVLTLTPGHEFELESDRAGRAAELRVAALFEGIPGVQVYTSLRIPDTGQGRGRREIDLILVTKRELFVVEVKNWSGAIELQPDGGWLQIRRNGTVQKHSNVVDDTKYRAQLLKSYIERRGMNVPSDFIQPKVFLVNPDCKPEQAIVMQPEVLSADQWENFMENNLGRTGSGWMSSLFGSQQSAPVLTEAAEKQLLYILSAAPTWDRLELYGGKIVVGDFHSFQGQPEEVQTLKFAKRSVVKQLTMTHRRGWVGHTLGFFVGRTPKVKVAVIVRDHRDANPTKPTKKQDFGFPLHLEVRPDLEIVFQPVANPKPVHYNLNDVLSLTLSA